MDRRSGALVWLLALIFLAIAFSEVSGAIFQLRVKRETPVAADLKDTPCAPNDYFKIDCNTCYCNMERTGYLCTENICAQTATNSSTTTQIPLANDTMLIISSKGVQVVPNYSLRHKAGNVVTNSSVTPVPATTTTDSANGLNLFGRFSRDGRRSQTEQDSPTGDSTTDTADSETTTTTETIETSSTKL